MISSPLGALFASTAKRTQRNTTISQFIRRCGKGYRRKPDEEIHGVRSGRVLSTGASVPVEMGVGCPPGVNVLTSLEVL